MLSPNLCVYMSCYKRDYELSRKIGKVLALIDGIASDPETVRRVIGLGNTG